MEADGGGDAVQRVPHVQGGQYVEAGQVGDRVGVVESGAEGDQGTAVVPGEREPVVAQGAGEGDDVGGHGALGVTGAVGLGGLVARAVATQVGADHGVVGREVGGDMAPHEVGLREAVQQHDGAAASGHGGVQGHAVRDGHAVVGEAGDDW